MHGRVSRKWRPSLMLVLGGTVIAVLALPLLGLLAAANVSEEFIWAVAAAVPLATAVLAFLLWRLLYGPITGLAERARKIGAGAPVPDTLLRHYGTAELGALGQNMHEMAAALRNREAAIRSFTDHATHELRTPLTAIRGAAELLEAGEGLAEEDRRLAGTILTAVARMERELNALRAVAEAREPLHRGETTLASVLPGLKADHPDLSIHAEGASVRLPLAGPGLQLVLTQLLRNAAEAGAGEVRLVADEGPVLTVADNGPGISEGNRALVFRPFFSTRREAGGTGMGLAIVSSLLQAHGAAVRLEGRGPGTRFVIEF